MRTESRGQILAAAEKLFARRGFFNVTIADVAREAAMSPGNIYWYFASKEDLLKAVLINGFDTLDGYLALAASGPGSALERLVKLMQLQLSFLREHSQFFQIYASLLGHGGEALFRQMSLDPVAIGGQYHQRICPIFAEAIGEKVLLPAEPDILAILFFSFFNGLVITYGSDWERIPEEQLIRSVLGLLGFSGEGSNL